MTREEEKEKAARRYATHDVDTDETDFYGNYVKKEDFVLPEYNAFIEGSKWSDENPKSSWISVEDDLPCNHKEIIINANSLNPITKKVLIYNKNKEIRVSWMLYRKDKGWVWDITAYSTPLFFMFIPELPKE